MLLPVLLTQLEFRISAFSCANTKRKKEKQLQNILLNNIFLLFAALSS